MRQPTQQAAAHNPTLDLLLLCMRPRLDGNTSKRILSSPAASPTGTRLLLLQQNTILRLARLYGWRSRAGPPF
jgi:hypothetical protein